MPTRRLPWASPSPSTAARRTSGTERPRSRPNRPTWSSSSPPSRSTGSSSSHRSRRTPPGSSSRSGQGHRRQHRLRHEPPRRRPRHRRSAVDRGLAGPVHPRAPADHRRRLDQIDRGPLELDDRLIIVPGVMARPVNADADATRRRMLDEAVRALRRARPRAARRCRDVAGAAGVSLAMVHHYFGSKDDLYEACIDATYGELSAMQGELARELAASAPLEELFARAVVTSFRFAREHRTAVRLLVRAAVSSGELHPRGRRLPARRAGTSSRRAVGERLGRSPAELRLPLQSVVFLVARYAAQRRRRDGGRRRRAGPREAPRRSRQSRSTSSASRSLSSA